MKCQGLSEEAARRPLLATSPLMTAAGLVSHLRWVEHYWFEHRLLGLPDRAPWTDTDPDAEFKDPAALPDLLAAYAAQCATSRTIAATLPLDTELAVPAADGDPSTLRWLLLHMVEETARHAGHLDILTELLDGRTGF
ncbi:DinB family protein [Actinocorallia lasiicapitis]